MSVVKAALQQGRQAAIYCKGAVQQQNATPGAHPGGLATAGGAAPACEGQYGSMPDHSSAHAPVGAQGLGIQSHVDFGGRRPAHRSARDRRRRCRQQQQGSQRGCCTPRHLPLRKGATQGGAGGQQRRRWILQIKVLVTAGPGGWSQSRAVLPERSRPENQQSVGCTRNAKAPFLTAKVPAQDQPGASSPSHRLTFLAHSAPTSQPAADAAVCTAPAPAFATCVCRAGVLRDIRLRQIRAVQCE